MKLVFALVLCALVGVADANLNMIAAMRFMKKLQKNNKEAKNVQNRYATGSPPPKSSYEQGLEMGMKMAESTQKVSDRMATIEVEAGQLAVQADQALSAAEVRAAEMMVEMEDQMVAAAPVVQQKLRNAEIAMNQAAQVGAVQLNHKLRNAEMLWNHHMYQANRAFEQNQHRLAQLEHQAHALNRHWARLEDRFWQGVNAESHAVSHQADNFMAGLAAGMDSFNHYPANTHVPSYTVAPHRGRGYWG